MSKTNEPFDIQVASPGTAEMIHVRITHETETFDFDIEGKRISILNNGDNSWSAIQNDIDQEMVNIIGSEIEKHFNRTPL